MTRKFFCILLLLLLPALVLAQPPRLTGIAPSVARPGSRVIVTGGPFTKDVRIMFGDRLVAPASLAERQLTFVVPDLPAGQYLLQLQTGEETSERSMFFRVVLPPPAILSLEPQTIDTCDMGAGRQVVVRGEGLQAGTLLLLDGAVLAAQRSAEDALTFAVPRMDSGLHQIQLVNPDEQKSLPVVLVINNTPEIENASMGEESVTSYELMITGKNFTYRSILLVNGQQIPSFNPTTPDIGEFEYTPYNLNQPGLDSVYYVDCRTMIYVRHPTTSQTKTLTLQIINPDGSESGVFSYTGP
ncbi:MAG: IPT/TIG domain-containing protein [Syntrophotaleaceae bacterium]